MKNILKSFVAISALSSLIVAPLIINAGQASAQPKKGTDASYVGIGVTGGLTNDGGNQDTGNFGGNVTGRVKLGKYTIVGTR